MQNSFLTSADRLGFVSYGLVNWAEVEHYAQEILQRFDVRAAGTAALANSLSGGNLQKFIVGREILQQPQLLVVSQPTWGVDAGAAAAIHEQIQRLVSAGAGALIISQDLDELMEISDRFGALNEGRLSEVRPAQGLTVDEIGMMMGGSHDMEVADV